MTLTLTELKEHNQIWFGTDNKRFFGDLEYKILHDDEHKPYLVRKTNAWSDMFTGVKKAHYRINNINEDLTIGTLIDQIFKDMNEVKEYLRG